MVSAPVQSVLYAVMTKSVGSGFRIHDDWEAPSEVRANTVAREAVLLGLTTAFTTGIQFLFTKALRPAMQKSPALRKYELLLRAVATAPALIFAEGVSREAAPKESWESRDDDDDDRFERRVTPVPATGGPPAPEQRFSSQQASPFQYLRQNRLPSGASFRYDASERDDD